MVKEAARASLQAAQEMHPRATYQPSLTARRNLMESVMSLAELLSQGFFYTLSFPGVHGVHFRKVLEKESTSRP